MLEQKVMFFIFGAVLYEDMRKDFQNCSCVYMQ